MSGDSRIDISDEQLERYLARRDTRQERWVVERKLRSNPAARAALIKLQSIWFLPRSLRDNTPDDDHIRELIAERVGDGVLGKASPSKPVRKQGEQILSIRTLSSRGLLRWVGYTAAVALILLATAHTRIWERIKSGARVNTPSHEYITLRAQRASVTLPDGSRVILGPETKLTASQGFGSDTRSVTLVGQAYFTVTHTGATPFVVRTPNSITRVLGTAFAVRAYATDRTPQVSVAEGKVAFGHNNPNVILMAGDVGRLKNDNTPVVERDAKISDAFGWTRGQLSFDEMPLRDAIPELERMYDIHIVVQDSVMENNYVLTAKLTDRSIHDMLETIVPPLGASYTLRGKTVTLTRR